MFIVIRCGLCTKLTLVTKHVHGLAICWFRAHGVDLQGFIHRDGRVWNFPLPPRNLEIQYGYYSGTIINISYLILHDTGDKYVSSKCLNSLSQNASEAI